MHREIAETGQLLDLGLTHWMAMLTFSKIKNIGGIVDFGEKMRNCLRSYEMPGCKVCFLGVPLFLIALLRS